jgi:hypothetical protein
MDATRQARMAAFDSVLDEIDEFEVEPYRPKPAEAAAAPAVESEPLSEEDASFLAALSDEG